ncbi:MAG TPA: [protein-PII] uridylyltransferase [Steroidobacteraceae bacterium]|nr:[protein-PII] uridylyltransferase [Steroidobacteraceae bacterium]
MVSMQQASLEEEELPAPSADLPAWPLLEQLAQRLDEGKYSREVCRSLLKAAQDDLQARFLAEENIETLVRARAQFIDALLVATWHHMLAGTMPAELALLAVGGYGRGELHPASDVDILVLTPSSRPLSSDERAQLESLITFLWDIGLEVGHSVRSAPECAEQAIADVGVMTTLLEARLLTGSPELASEMRDALSPDKVWPADRFFEAKLAEQRERHLKANDTAYNLEPNVKNGPGGLRDLQTIGWVAKRHFGAQSLDELVEKGFLTPAELRKLKQAQAFLWKVRFGLHVLTGRHEDRLLFDHQIRLAQSFGYEDASYTLAVEQLMQRYYRTVLDVSFLNELLLQAFRDVILPGGSVPQGLNARFQIRNEYLETTSPDMFARYPAALLELFVLLQQNPQVRGVSANTMRAVARHLWLIDEEFRQNPRNHRLFLDILRAPAGVTHELRRMNTYGVLGRYIPAFGRIVGRMQYDLFHAYTVDAHTLFVVSNLRRLALPKYDNEMPKLSSIMQQLPKQEIIYLAALFHDIAKGRGGDHSELGAVDAEAFCLEQGLSPYDARLVAWLVKNHLTMSITAQKKDTGDPAVINDFARVVGDETRLDYLYLLTCADVRGTNPKLWNSWKASLFHDFYESVRAALRRGLESPLDEDQLINENRQAAQALLAPRRLEEAEIERIWGRLSKSFFLRHSPEEIAWFTGLCAEREGGADEPLVAVHPHSERGTTSVLIYAPHRRHGFARATAVLDQQGLTIVDARITPTANGFSLDLYHVLEDNGTPVTDAERIEDLGRLLWNSLRRPEETPTQVSRRAPRQVRMFNTPTRVTITRDLRNNRSALELVAGDRPGLLSDVGKVLWEERLDLQGARISTIGERAEDVFYVTDTGQQPLDDAAAAQLQERLVAALTRPA